MGGVADIDSKRPRDDTTVAHNTTSELSTVLQPNTFLIWNCGHNTKVCKCATCKESVHCCASTIDGRELKVCKESSMKLLSPAHCSNCTSQCINFVDPNIVDHICVNPSVTYRCPNIELLCHAMQYHKKHLVLISHGHTCICAVASFPDPVHIYTHDCTLVIPRLGSKC